MPHVCIQLWFPGLFDLRSYLPYQQITLWLDKYEVIHYESEAQITSCFPSVGRIQNNGLEKLRLSVKPQCRFFAEKLIDKSNIYHRKENNCEREKENKDRKLCICRKSELWGFLWFLLGNECEVPVLQRWETCSRWCNVVLGYYLKVLFNITFGAWLSMKQDVDKVLNIGRQKNTALALGVCDSSVDYAECHSFTAWLRIHRCLSSHLSPPSVALFFFTVAIKNRRKREREKKTFSKFEESLNIILPQGNANTQAEKNLLDNKGEGNTNSDFCVQFANLLWLIVR